MLARGLDKRDLQLEVTIWYQGTFGQTAVSQLRRLEGSIEQVVIRHLLPSPRNCQSNTYPNGVSAKIDNNALNDTTALTDRYR